MTTHTGSDNIIMRFLKNWFGHFSKEELKKFIKLGVIFGLVIGVYWALRPLKDSIFGSMAGPTNRAWAKVVSLIVLFPLIIFYNKLVDKLPRHRLFYVLGSIYAVASIAFGYLLLHPTIGLPNTTVDGARIMPWVWYVFIESYGSLVVALFWAFAADMVLPDSAKRGFPIVVMIGQMGAIFGPLMGKLIGNESITVFLCGAFILLMMLGVYLFMVTTPKEQLTGYHRRDPGASKEVEPGFLEGLKLMLREPYLLGIFGVISIYEIIVTIIDYRFKFLVDTTFRTVTERSAYLQDFAMYVNIVSFLCLLFGISNIQRRLGIKVSLVLMPIIVAVMVGSFMMFPVVHVILWIMVFAKAVNYALNGPAMKQLYVPTSHDVKYKSQAWIETFGSRSSKAAGSGFNLLDKPFMGWFGKVNGVAYLVAIGSYLSFGLIVAWFFVALYLGKTYQKAVDQNKVVC
jgi:AAA family ATP:ADP antiporter